MENEKKYSCTQLEMKENIIQKLFNQQKEIENEPESRIKEREEKINQKANDLKNYIAKKNKGKNFWKKNAKI